MKRVEEKTFVETVVLHCGQVGHLEENPLGGSQKKILWTEKKPRGLNESHLVELRKRDSRELTPEPCKHSLFYLQNRIVNLSVQLNLFVSELAFYQVKTNQVVFVLANQKSLALVLINTAHKVQRQIVLVSVLVQMIEKSHCFLMGYFFANVRVSQLKIFLRSLLLLGSPLSIRRLLLLLYRRSGVIYLSSHERPLLIGSTLRRSLLLFSSSLLLLSSGVLL